ncbi:hypothetical protein KP509_13G056900 [Ceratopteris richardii]|uniref:RING-type domain-containing protein n=1 Tax=Ceratopteris richardii TaxID=49495 RepID=A0A8T2TG03_CERRI|nr:hypothetical protein KP509_13G056900 [Ceratopteris richardii]
MTTIIRLWAAAHRRYRQRILSYGFSRLCHCLEPLPAISSSRQQESLRRIAPLKHADNIFPSYGISDNCPALLLSTFDSYPPWLFYETFTHNNQNITLPANGTSLLAERSTLNANINDSFCSPAPKSSNQFPANILIFICILTVFTASGVLSLYIHKCSADPESSNTATNRMVHINPSFGSDTGNRYGGDLISSLPTQRFSNQQCVKLSDNNLHGECVVCLSAFEEGEELCQLPMCGHCFHKDCVAMWFFSHLTCPLCRRSIPSKLEQNSNTCQCSTESAQNHSASDMV